MGSHDEKYDALRTQTLTLMKDRLRHSMFTSTRIDLKFETFDCGEMLAASLTAWMLRLPDRGYVDVYRSWWDHLKGTLYDRFPRLLRRRRLTFADLRGEPFEGPSFADLRGEPFEGPWPTIGLLGPTHIHRHYAYRFFPKSPLLVKDHGKPMDIFFGQGKDLP